MLQEVRGQGLGGPFWSPSTTRLICLSALSWVGTLFLALLLAVPALYLIWAVGCAILWLVGLLPVLVTRRLGATEAGRRRRLVGSASAHSYAATGPSRTCPPPRWRSGTGTWPTPQPWGSPIRRVALLLLDFRTSLSARDWMDVWHAIRKGYRTARAARAARAAGVASRRVASE
ncbi:MAG: hypothetical protein ACYDAD_07705 [Acidimicrobiales bacterium]